MNKRFVIEILNNRASKINEEDLTITHIINTNCLDRYDTVVIPEGVNAKNFLKNAVVLWAHNHDKSQVTIPIAKCINLEIEKDKITVTTQFNRDDPFSVKVFNAYKTGFLNAWSIGFMTLNSFEVSFETQEYVNQKYGTNLNLTAEDYEKKKYWGVWIIDSWELYEYSAVPIPGNPECLSAEEVETFSKELVSRGLLDEETSKTFDFRKMLEVKLKEKSEKEIEDEEEKKRLLEETAKKEAAELAAKNEAEAREKEEADKLALEKAKEEQAAKDKVLNLEKEIASLLEKVNLLEAQVNVLNKNNTNLSEKLEKAVSVLSNIDKLEKQIVDITNVLSTDNLDKLRSLETVDSSRDTIIDGWFGNFIKHKHN